MKKGDALSGSSPSEPFSNDPIKPPDTKAPFEKGGWGICLTNARKSLKSIYKSSRVQKNLYNYLKYSYHSSSKVIIRLLYIHGDSIIIPYNRKLKPRSRELRSNMTPAEKILWEKIRKKQLLNLQFYRQKPLGNYIVDFYCPKGKVVIEVDGMHHYQQEQKKYDEIKDAFLRGHGLVVLRFSNEEILKNIIKVIQELTEKLLYNRQFQDHQSP